MPTPSTSLVTLGAITVRQFNERITAIVSGATGLRNVWVVGETSDLRVSGGNCYFEFVEKDDDGSSSARIRAMVWRNVWGAVNAKFFAATGSQIASGMKLMLRVSASYHPSYGMAVTVSDVNPEFTLGDAVRRRNEIIRRLTAEGLIERQRRLKWPMPALRVAVISAKGAAGYGDFINQLFTAPEHFSFKVGLFPAVMQGDRTVPSVTAALEAIAAEAYQWDCVVIIRGGGSTTDLAAFDDYGLARAIALFPLPVIVGIGHERDITVLDYVAIMRVKTPTAAAEWLLSRARRMLQALDNATNAVLNAVRDSIAANREQLARIGAELPGYFGYVLHTSRGNLDKAATVIGTVPQRVLPLERQRLRTLTDNLAIGLENAVTNARARLDKNASLAIALSPQTTLRRGFTITCDAKGHTVRSTDDIVTGSTIITYTAEGSLSSTVTEIDNTSKL